MAALERLEHFVAHGGLLMAPEDMEALKSVLRELRAAREVVTDIVSPKNDFDCGFNDGLRHVSEKMKEVRVSGG